MPCSALNVPYENSTFWMSTLTAGAAAATGAASLSAGMARGSHGAGAGLAQRARHQAQHVLGGAHDHRDHDDRQRHRAGPGGEMTHLDHHRLVDEQADDDRRGAEQDVVDEPHDLADPMAARILGEE